MSELAKAKEFGRVSGLDKLSEIESRLIRRRMALLGDPPVAIVMGDGRTVSPGSGKPVGAVIIRDRKTLLKFFVRPERHFGDAYSEGDIEVAGDLVEVLEAAFRCMSRKSAAGLIKKITAKIMNRPRLNTFAGSRDNIHRHYDIGNDFYRLWLDERMQYTCAYFPSPSATLEEAQTAKMDHVCRKLMLRPGETVVEAGCGWGTLALHMAKQYGVRVKAYNISHEQVQSARERAKAEGLDDRVEYIEDDYRNITGAFDVFVSVGMLEHVGAQYYREFGKVIQRALKEDGRGLIHSIGRNKAELMNPWIEKRIFPGAYPPTLREMMEIFEPAGFSVLDVENLRLHYAKTLEHWLERFEKASGPIAGMFDRKFIRAWRLYLAGSIAAFAAGDLQLFQVVFAKQHNNDIPWTRAHLYAGMRR
ncbi:MAG TPA: cyclopropane-fatty-acyl-phospholipid synthase family protein [Nitrospirota bacterium]